MQRNGGSGSSLGGACAAWILAAAGCGSGGSGIVAHDGGVGMAGDDGSSNGTSGYDSGGATVDVSSDAPDVDGSPTVDGARTADGSGASLSDADADAADGATTLPSCTWAAALDPTDATAGRCVAARTIAVCQTNTSVSPNGGIYICLGNDPTQCASDNFDQCANTCGPAEYGVQCSGATPPSGCTHGSIDAVLFPNVYCCPCGSLEGS